MEGECNDESSDDKFFWEEGDPIEDHPDFDPDYEVIPPDKSPLGDMSNIHTPEQAIEHLRSLGITTGTVEVTPNGSWHVNFTATD